jgi:hypothetical protein
LVSGSETVLRLLPKFRFRPIVRRRSGCRGADSRI